MVTGEAPRLLAVCYGGGHVAAVLPVVHELQERGWNCTTLALTTAYERAHAEGLDCLSFVDLLTDADDDARSRGEEMASELGSGRIPHDETVAYLGLSFTDLVDQIGTEAALQRYEAQGRAAFLPVPTLERAVERVQPSVILTTNAPRAERAALHVARKRDIASVAIIDLFGSGDTVWVPDFATTTFCVLGQMVADRLIANGADPTNIVVTGNPAFDGLGGSRPSQGAQRLRDELRGRLSVRADQPIVLAALPPTQTDEFAAWVHEGLRDSDAVLCLRHHPSTAVTTSVSFAGTDFDAPGHLDVSLESWLAAAQVVISTGSTVSLQAVLSGTATILVEGWGSLGFSETDLSAWAPTRTVSSHTELHDHVTQLLKAESGVTHRREPDKPPAAHRVATIVEQAAAR